MYFVCEIDKLGIINKILRYYEGCEFYVINQIVITSRFTSSNVSILFWIYESN